MKSLKRTGPAGWRNFASGLAMACALQAAPMMAQAEGAALRWAVNMDVPSIDPVYQSNNWEYVVAMNLYDGLIWPDGANGYKPWIAEEWSVSDDALTYTFRIRDGLKFHDGSAVTAEDVAFSMVRMLTLNGPAASNFRMIKTDGVALVDEQTVSFTLDEANSAFLAALLTFKVVNKDLVMANLAAGGHGEFGDYGVAYLQSHDAGSGPYKIENHRPGEIARMVRFDDYTMTAWDPEAPGSVEFRITPEAATIGAMLQAGEIDIADWALPITVQRQISSDSRFVLREDPQATAWYVIMNNASPPLDDVAVRRAVAHAYDSATVTQHILGGGGPLAGPVPAMMLDQCEGIATYHFNLDAARAALAESRYSPEELAAFSLEVAAVAGSDRFNNIALSLATNLKRIGLSTEVRAVRWADIGQAQTTPETAYDFVVFYDGAKVPDPNVFLVYYTPDGWGDAFPPGGMYYENQAVTELIQTGIRSTDAAPRNAAYCDAVKLIAEESPSVFSHTDVRQTTHWAYVDSFPPAGGALFYDMRFENWRMDVDSPDLIANQN